MTLTLIIGGARSGKSTLAERLAAASGSPVKFIATMTPADDEMRSRVLAHQQTRPASWATVEAPTDLLTALRTNIVDGQCVLIDCLTMCVSNMLIQRLGDAAEATSAAMESAVAECIETVVDLVSWAAGRAGVTIVVSNEVGSGVVPAYTLGRVYRDALGRSNAVLAGAADCVYVVTAGLAVDVKALGATPVGSLGAEPRA